MQAFISLLSTPDYLPGVACLAASLKRTGTTLPLVVATSPGLPAATLSALAACEGVDRVLPLQGQALLPPSPSASSQHRHWDHTFDKLRLFGLPGFSKLVYLDSDMLVLAALDDLFDAPHMAAVAAGRLLYPDWTRLNSGLMVIEPQAALPARMAATLPQALREMHERGSPALGDQDLINTFHERWPAEGAHLDEGDNVFFDHLERYVASGRYALRPTAGARAVRIVHFTGRDKPWMLRGRVRHALEAARGRHGPTQREVLQAYRRQLQKVQASAGEGRLGGAWRAG